MTAHDSNGSRPRLSTVRVRARGEEHQGLAAQPDDDDGPLPGELDPGIVPFPPLRPHRMTPREHQAGRRGRGIMRQPTGGVKGADAGD